MPERGDPVAVVPPREDSVAPVAVLEVVPSLVRAVVLRVARRAVAVGTHLGRVVFHPVERPGPPLHAAGVRPLFGDGRRGLCADGHRRDHDQQDGDHGHHLITSRAFEGRDPLAQADEVEHHGRQIAVQHADRDREIVLEPPLCDRREEHEDGQREQEQPVCTRLVGGDEFVEHEDHAADGREQPEAVRLLEERRERVERHGLRLGDRPARGRRVVAEDAEHLPDEVVEGLR